MPGPSFPTTRWSLVFDAGNGSGDAFAELYRRYHFPLYAYARRQGESAEQAADLIQGFFARTWEKQDLTPTLPIGRFRSWILALFKHYRSTELRYQRALKRGGGAPMLSLDLSEEEGRFLQFPSQDLDPERLYLRCWALATVDHAMQTLREDQIRRGMGLRFEVLSPYLGGKEDPSTHAVAAARLGMKVESIKVTVSRLRARFREILREQVLQTLDDPRDLDAELTLLLQALA